VVNCGQPSQQLVIHYSPLVLKPQPIDLQKEYPCPCCRGQINPLVLTEALGCDRCHKIFVLRDDNYTLEQISNPYPHSWQWDGQTWRSTKQLPTANFSLYIVLLLSLGCLALGTWYFWTGSQVHPLIPKPVTSENQEQ
jgi:hypothetical protein